MILVCMDPQQIFKCWKCTFYILGTYFHCAMQGRQNLIFKGKPMITTNENQTIVCKQTVSYRPTIGCQIGSNSTLEVIPITYFFFMTKVSLENLVIFVRVAHLILYLPNCISCDQESNANKLWHLDALIYVDNGWFLIKAIDRKLGCQILVNLGYLSGFPIPEPLYYAGAPPLRPLTGQRVVAAAAVFYFAKSR